jgi:hypothetical protein
MGTSAGPNIQGIGRGGATNLVLEMDAHDAKSYPGEPTSNIFSNPNNWTGSDWTQTNGTIANNASEGPNGGSAGSITATNADPYIYSNLVHSVATGGLTFSCWVKGVGGSVGKSGDIRINFAGTATGSATTVNYTLTGLWQRVSISGTVTGAGTIKVGIEPPNSATVGDVVYLADAQLEQKSYATPFVREGNGGTGTYNARPTSVDLMIHGNVGTGTTFEDSSPKKLALTNTNGVSHAGSSEFGGSALKFVRSSSQRIEVASSDAGNFGTGDWTIDYWFNMNSGQTERMHSISMGTYATSNISLNFNDGNAFWLYWNGSGGNNIIWGSDGDYGDGAWHHMAVTRRLGMIRVWVDGVHKGSNNYSSGTSMGSTDVISIGSSGSSVLWDGYLDEIRITKGTALWSGSGNFTPPTRRNLNAPVVDRSGSNNGGNFNTKDMTDVTNYRVGEVIRPIGNAVWDFDGTDDYIQGGKGCRVGNTRQKSIESWVRGVTSGTKTLLFMGDHGNNYKWQWTTIGGGQYMTGSGYGTRYYWPDGYLTAAGWHHWVDVVDENQGATHRVRRYVDGVLLTPNQLPSDTGDSFYDGSDMYLDIGKAEFGSGPYGVFDGEIGAIRIYGIALTAQQVRENFNQQRNRFGK